MSTKKRLALSDSSYRKKNIIAPKKKVAKNVPLIASPANKKPSDFFGILNPEESEKFEKHIQRIRSEWDRKEMISLSSANAIKSN